MKEKKPVSKMNKPELLEEVKRLKDIEERYFRAETKFENMKSARESDLLEVDEARKIKRESKAKEQLMVNAYNSQIEHLKKTVKEQSELILSLFDTTDNLFNQQRFFYKKYKGIFISDEEIKKEAIDDEKVKE